MLVNKWVVIFVNSLFSRNFRKKINIDFAKISQNRGKFVIAGKYIGQILCPNLVNVWVSFHFPSGTSLQQKNT